MDGILFCFCFLFEQQQKMFRVGYLKKRENKKNEKNM